MSLSEGDPQSQTYSRQSWTMLLDPNSRIQISQFNPSPVCGFSDFRLRFNTLIKASFCGIALSSEPRKWSIVVV